MEVKINKEIRNYTESMFFGLSMRQFLFSVLACGVAVGLFFLLRGKFGTETVSWMCVLGASPFAVMGFVKYNGMTAEFEKTADSLEIMPQRCPWLTGEYIPRNAYRFILFEKRYMIIFQIVDDIVYADYVVDCRQDYGWLIR